MNAITIDEVKQAARRLAAVLQATPLLPLRPAAAVQSVYLQPELFQVIGSFKIRGVYNAVTQLTVQQRAAGLSTVSAGNTAQALAWCARHFGVVARSLMPEGAPQTKLDAVRKWGGQPIVVSRDELFRFLREERWNDEPYAFIHPWTDRNVMIGHGTIGLELHAALPDLAAVYVPVGGGGLIGGVAATLKQLNPAIRIIAVEPVGCAAFHASLAAGRPVAAGCDTICDGVAVPYFTQEVFDRVAGFVDEAVLVTDDDVRLAVAQLAQINKLVVEPSGALAVVAASQQHDPAAGTAVALVTGGAIEPSLLADLLTTPGATPSGDVGVDGEGP
ncbi:MAG: pyridoxal-phosphate dependent enzyme [Planctomycetota bacterium]